MNDYAGYSGPPFPSPPPGGGYLVLTRAHISNFDFVCAVKTIYPQTKIIVQRNIPTT